jgi:hypothetical protein
MGQKNCVTVKKFYVKGSVEERIMEVVKQRKEAVGGAATAAGSAASTAAAAAEMDDEELHAAAFGRGRGGHGRSNVRMQDLVGSIQTDRQNLRVGELEILFQVRGIVRHLFLLLAAILLCIFLCIFGCRCCLAACPAACMASRLAAAFWLLAASLCCGSVAAWLVHRRRVGPAGLPSPTTCTCLSPCQGFNQSYVPFVIGLSACFSPDKFFHLTFLPACLLRRRSQTWETPECLSLRARRKRRRRRRLPQTGQAALQPTPHCVEAASPRAESAAAPPRKPAASAAARAAARPLPQPRPRRLPEVARSVWGVVRADLCVASTMQSLRQGKCQMRKGRRRRRQG